MSFARKSPRLCSRLSNKRTLFVAPCPGRVPDAADLPRWGGAIAPASVNGRTVPCRLLFDLGPSHFGARCTPFPARNTLQVSASIPSLLVVRATSLLWSENKVIAKLYLVRSGEVYCKKKYRVHTNAWAVGWALFSGSVTGTAISIIRNGLVGRVYACGGKKFWRPVAPCRISLKQRGFQDLHLTGFILNISLFGLDLTCPRVVPSCLIIHPCHLSSRPLSAWPVFGCSPSALPFRVDIINKGDRACGVVFSSSRERTKYTRA